MTQAHDEEILKTLQGLDKRVEVIATNCQHCQKVIGEHHATLYGNGDDGLKYIMLSVQAQMSGVAKALEEVKSAASSANSGTTQWFQKTLGTVVLVLVAIVAATFGVKQLATWPDLPSIQEGGGNK